MPTMPDAACAGRGSVTGLLLESGTGAAISNEPVYLVAIAGGDEFPVAALDRQSASQAITAADGSFEVTCIPQGRHVVVVGHEGTGGMVADQRTGATLVVVVEAGQVVDLGTIVIPRP